MKVVESKGSDERRILIAMIVDRVVCSHVAAVWDKRGLFVSKWANLIAGWCVRYYNKYEQAPNANIEAMYERWASRNSDKATSKLIERLLDSLSGEYEQTASELNGAYFVDRAGEYFNEVRLQRLSESISADLTDGDGLKALARVSTFGQVEMGTSHGVDVLRDTNAMKEAFDQKKDPLVRYPGDLGRFFADAFERDAFISFMGPEKRGKTWWLIDVAWRAMLQRRRVAFFSVGDMSQHQMMRRFQVRAARQPLRAKTIKYPMSVTTEQGEPYATTVLAERVFEKSLSWRAGLKACEKILKKTKSKSTLLRLACYPNSTMSVAGLQSVLSTWERGGWTPDVIIIDYADILANPPGYNESRDAVNASWKAMRAMSQSLHCCVVTATQADAASYRASTIDASNFSEDKRKLAHVTGMVGLNTTIEEKEQQLMRLNWIVLRESEFSVMRCCHVAGCFDIGNPAIKSTF